MQKDMTKTEEIDEFKEHVKKWMEVSQEHGKTSNEAGKYYDEYILPCVVDTFVEKFKDGLLAGKKYDGLILTVGGSPEPVILSICAIESEQIGLICNEGRKKSIDRIVEKTDLRASDLVSAGSCTVNGSDTQEIYQAVMNFYTKWGEPKKIALGITGGTKVMSSAAAMAGAILGADIYYVDTGDKNELNKPVPRSEYLRLLENPYTVFGDFEARKAKQLFERHDYAGARDIFKVLTGQIGRPERLIIYQAYELLCEAYHAWDNFNVQHASTKLKEILAHLTTFQRSTELKDLHDHKSRLEEQKESLDCLSSFVNNDRNVGLPCDVSDRFHFAFTLYQNALRRSIQGKYDLACLLLYRLLEWIGQCRLDKYQIDTDANTHNYSEAGDLCAPAKTEEQILDQYTKQSKKVGEPGSPSKKNLPAGRITLVDMYLLLYALGDDLIENNFDWTKFNDGIKTRNKSVYIHGRRVVDAKGFKGFHGTVEHIFKKAQELEGIDASEFKDRHEFIVL